MTLSSFGLWLQSASGQIQWQCQFREFPPHPAPAPLPPPAPAHSPPLAPPFSSHCCSARSLLLCQHKSSEVWAPNSILSEPFLNPKHFINPRHTVALRAVMSTQVMEPSFFRWRCPVATVFWNCGFSNSVLPFQVHCRWNPKCVK